MLLSLMAVRLMAVGVHNMLGQACGVLSCGCDCDGITVLDIKE